MKQSIATMALIGIATVTLTGCNPATAPVQGDSGTAAAEPVTASPTAASTATAATSGEPGSGTYAADCSKAGDGFAITLAKGADGMVGATVKQGGKSYDNLLTSYSYMGQDTPQNFLVAVLFDEGKSPVPASEDGASLEIWKGEAAYYALVNGDKAKRLMFCS